VTWTDCNYSILKEGKCLVPKSSTKASPFCSFIMRISHIFEDQEKEKASVWQGKTGLADGFFGRDRWSPAEGFDLGNVSN